MPSRRKKVIILVNVYTFLEVYNKLISWAELKFPTKSFDLEQKLCHQHFHVFKVSRDAFNILLIILTNQYSTLPTHIKGLTLSDLHAANNFMEFHKYVYHAHIIDRIRSMSDTIHTILVVVVCYKVQINPSIDYDSTGR